MTEKMSQHDKLFEEAFDLIIRLHGDPANPAARELADQWRAISTQHQVVWAEAIKLHKMTGKMVQARSEAVLQPKGLSRRHFLLGSSVAVAATAAGIIFLPNSLLQLKASHLTLTGELQSVSLEDGSQIILGPDSAIATHYTPNERRIELLQGMAWFDVAEDIRRPFFARVEGLEVTTRKGAFDLSSDAGRLTVAVEQDAVEAATVGLPLSLNESLGAGHWLTLNEKGERIKRGIRPVQQLASWRSGILVADDDPLAVVVARIARWVPGKVVVASNELGAQRISGVYNLSNPQRALSLAIQSSAGKMREITPWLTVISPV
ncbi:FecR family protein [Klebsiella sp. BIGb0407]|uniref:FecR family protein n=1 Tax=Klebsiella sp. BIGb0407 TaxID=2940603 RepID=UPI002168832B|nr:FecR domain-containing protein [Klebsiella sp. BIGb0407]MCS3431811.1 transmembrane sensor [Klebsiella sp. BIGb0407]